MSLAVSVALLLAVVALVLLVIPEAREEHLIETWQMKREFTSTKHKWDKSKTRGFYFCALCSKIMSGFWSNILECRKCGILIHHYCRYLKLKKPECKFIISSTQNKGNAPIHQWRQGIHSVNAICSYCDLVCTGFEAYMCLWCQRMKHPECQANPECDFGNLKGMILPPNNIFCEEPGKEDSLFESLKTRKRKLKEKTSDSSGDQVEIKFKFKSTSIAPVIVIVNSKSGGQAGSDYLKAFYQLLNPLQVISVLEEGLSRLKIFKDLANIKLVVAGGDGTICSVLNFLTSGVVDEWVQNNPPVAILPLGTGNDLSRSLGWGSGEEDRDAKTFLEELKNSRTTQLDRWTLKIFNESNEIEKQLTVYNYLGIGLDAKVCLDFHELRERYPKLFVSQFSNKILYAQMGSIYLLDNKVNHLNDLMTLEVDGRNLDLKGLENIVLLNITHWAGGASDLWNSSSVYKRQQINDGMVEILGVADMLHLGQVQVGMDLPLQLAQGKEIKLCSKQGSVGKVAFQIDGQPFQLQTPFRIQFCYKDKVKMETMAAASIDDKLQRILTVALKDKVISQHQYNYITDKLLN